MAPTVPKKNHELSKIILILKSWTFLTFRIVFNHFLNFFKSWWYSFLRKNNTKTVKRCERWMGGKIILKMWSFPELSLL